MSQKRFYIEREVTPSEYLRLERRDARSIERVSVMPAKLGQRGFGRIVVSLKPGKQVQADFTVQPSGVR